MWIHSGFPCRLLLMFALWCSVSNINHACQGFSNSNLLQRERHPIPSNSYNTMHQRAMNMSVTCSTKSMVIVSEKNPITKAFQAVHNQWKDSIEDMKDDPLQYLTIPLIAALVGYITNYVGVSMLFYPIEWKGVPFKRWAGQPLGLFGWQGIVPAKRMAMAGRMVDVTVSKLLKIPEIFGRLESHRMATLLSSSVSKVLYMGMLPISVVKFYLQVVSKQVILHIENLVNVKDIVVKGMTKDPRTLGQFFQKVGYKELQFLVESGTYFGFILGLMQMVQWMLYPKNWTLPVGGAAVGYITNWIALKLIFEPLNPTKYGPFTIQGLFLTRQKEVSAEFSSFIAANVLTSQEIWKSLLTGTKSSEFAKIIKENVPFLSPEIVKQIMSTLKEQLISGKDAARHPLHIYTNKKIELESTLVQRMRRLSPAEFEQVLRPIFQEDEIILILAGGVLGALAGGLQWGLNVMGEQRRERRMREKLLEAGLEQYEEEGKLVFVPDYYTDSDAETEGTMTGISRMQRSGKNDRHGGIAPMLTKKIVREYTLKLTPEERARELVTRLM